MNPAKDNGWERRIAFVAAAALALEGSMRQ